MKKLVSVCILCLILSGICIASAQYTMTKPTEQNQPLIFEKPKTSPKTINPSKIPEIQQGIAFLKSLNAGVGYGGM